MSDDWLRALGAAWRVTIIALTIFAAAMAVSPFWDSAMFLSALEEILTADANPQPPDTL